MTVTGQMGKQQDISFTDIANENGPYEPAKIDR